MQNKIKQIKNNGKRKFSNAKDNYYTIENIEYNGEMINMLFTKREILVAIEKYKKFYKVE